ncbi:(2R)-3-sulfolactate dehydrogenase (NADP+) [Murinocardiopsis flavida]|uniref:(2R)-3-sulfolactate dehydrogenase (NADP+) n=1 Tax=Murinocardiopsis flavida TaxID=645275 RepID=A0A2P8DTU8_9ACTN|nr:Ldh family oxidoreductase [Murinocardiopsis flavida]PSL00635.1 (2R)-3-sulfolactate dehydrogenase (NADP+) [Murinocardiopsis flavida]
MKITLDRARRLTESLLGGAGLAPERAAVTARAITLADAWGIGSHGMFRLPVYLDRLAAGGYPPGAELTAVRDTGPVLMLDGGGGIGHWQVAEAAEYAVERAGRYGVALVGVANGGHSGALGCYALDIARAGLVGLVFANGPAALPPWGGSAALLSTSPIAAGIPTEPRPAVVDMALSAVARGKVAALAKRGEELPEGWALDAEGRPTTDPMAALRGMLAPLGGPKGYALAFLVEALTAGLVGPYLSADVPDFFDDARNAEPQRISHLVVAVDPELVGDPADPGGSAARLNALAERTAAAGGRLPGSRRTPPESLDGSTMVDIDSEVLADLEDRARLL